jgi:hypothetical protein
MNLIDVELEYSELMVRSLTKNIKDNFFVQSISFLLLIGLIITFKKDNWINGFAIGINLVNLINSIVVNANNKKDLRLYKVKVDLYRDIKNRLP